MNSSAAYPRVAVLVGSGEVDVVVGELFSLGAVGVEERDDSTLVGSREPGKVTLVATFSSDQAARDAMGNLNEAWKPVRDDVAAQDWDATWRKLTQPFYLTPTVLVRPTWDTSPTPRHIHVLTLEPGRAFGSGTHPTTSLVATIIERQPKRFEGQPVLDVGCGSGLLALCALVHGASLAVAVDNDTEAVKETVENAARNGLASQVDASDTDVSRVPGSFPLVMANIQAGVLVGMAEHLRRRVASGGLLVLSGVLEHQVDEVTQAFSPDMRLLAITQRYEWVAMEFEHARS